MAKKQIEQTEIQAPYDLPDGWKWEKTNSLADIFTGNSINENVKKEKYTGISEGLNFIGTKDIDFDGTINYENGVKISDYENFRTVPENTPLLCIEGGSAGKKLGITSEKVCFGNKLCAFVCKTVEPKLVYYYLQSNAFFYSFMKERHGLIGGVSVGTLKNIPFPLPPTLNEQTRIVSRIEFLFSKLDSAKEKAQNVVDSFENRKAAILHKAFTGELTKKWRTKNSVSEETWEEKTIGECLICIKDKYDPTKDEKLEMPYIGLENIEKGKGIISIGDSNSVKSIKTLFKSEDLLYGKLRPYLDKHDIANFDGMCSTDILVYRNNNENNIYYFNYIFSQKNFIRYASENSKGINLPRTSEKEISNFTQKVPTLPEQQEIVRILDIVLEKENKAKEAAENVLGQIELLKKAILARAFRGEL